MKATVIVLLICISQAFAIGTYSQNTRLNLSLTNVTIERVMEAIENQSEFYFMYEAHKVNVDKTVSIMANNQTVQKILDELFQNSGIAYKIDNRQIALTSTESAINFEQQARSITGKVTDSSGSPLPGVSVVVKGTTTGTITDADGKYSLANIPSNSTLQFSFVGMKTQEVAVGTKTAIDVALVDETIGIDEVVAIGYGTSSKKNLTTAISTVDAEKLKNLPVASITDGMAGRTAGLIVTQSGGGIGKKSTISIRGGGTPIVVIDGFVAPYQDFENLNSDDIESMSVLKDASAAAVYGSRAGDGVLVVKTKNGIRGLHVDYSRNSSLSEPTLLEKKLSSYDRAMFDNTVRSTYKMDPRWTAAELEKFKTGSDPFNYPNTDWQALMLRDYTPETKNSITLKGGTDINKFLVSLQSYDQESMYKAKTNWLKRYNFRMSETSEFKKLGLILHFGLDGYMTEIRDPRSQYSGGYSQTWGHIQNQGPGSIALNDKGQIYVGYDNPMAEVSSESGYSKSSDKMITASTNADWDVYGVKGLKVKLAANYRLGVFNNKTWQKTATQYDLAGNPGPSFPVSLSYQNFNSYQYTTQAFVDYSRTFNDVHNISATAGYEQTYGFYESTWLQRKNYVFMIDQMGAGPSSTMENSGSEGEFGRAGFVGRASYNYRKKYFIEGSLRRDGSDLFPADKRWGTFYAGSAAYAISEESFFRPLIDKNILTYFKVRASYGQVGLDSGVGRFSYLSSYGLDERGYVIDGSLVPTFSEGALVSPDITWYTTNSSDFGFDFKSLGDRLAGSFDYFFMKTKGYLTSPSNVGYTDPLGLSLPKVKSNGETRRAGYEFSLSWKDKFGELNYELGGNFTYFDALTAVAFNEDLANQKNPYKRVLQQSGYWGQGYTNLGYYTNADDVMNAPRRDGSTNIVAGDIKYKDLNGDGYIDGTDQGRIGKNGFPRGNYGIFGNFSYKGFFSNILFQGSTSRDMYIEDVVRGQSTGGYTMVYPYQLDYWTPDNRSAMFPRIAPSSSINGNNNYVTSDFWLTNGRYFRLKSVQVGYNFRSVLLKKAQWLYKLELVLSGQNLFTISPSTKYGFDPETGSTNNYDYPVMRVYSLSLNIGL